MSLQLTEFSSILHNLTISEQNGVDRMGFKKLNCWRFPYFPISNNLQHSARFLLPLNQVLNTYIYDDQYFNFVINIINNVNFCFRGLIHSSIVK